MNRLLTSALAVAATFATPCHAQAFGNIVDRFEQSAGPLLIARDMVAASATEHGKIDPRHRIAEKGRSAPAP